MSDPWTDRALAVDPREEKLPRWAREKLAALRHQVQVAHDRANDAIQETGPDDSLVVIERHQYRVGIKDDHITFLPKKGADYLEAIEVSPYYGGIAVHGRRGQLQVAPHSGNVVRIRSGDFW